MQVFEFTNAIVRTPANSIVDGLRQMDVGPPSIEGVKEEHAAYIRALEEAGLSVETLPALERFPDSVFVEDTALVFRGTAIVLKPGASTRGGEAAEIAPVLQRRFDRVMQLGDGFVDGGDVLVTPGCVFVGKSERTNALGADSLVSSLGAIGMVGRAVTTPHGVLHLKSDCALLDEASILSTARLAAAGVFEGFRVVLVPEGEEAAANAVRVNDRLLVSDAYPRTAEMLANLGYRIVPLPTGEIAKVDAGLSCLSLRWCA
ncbi:MAG: hypothetical protein ABL883_03365 [Terricaulis sp.]